MAKDLGVVTSYGYAMSTGRLPAGMTEEEYAEKVADFALAAQTAVDARDAARAAQSAAETAEGNAETAATHAAGSATTASGAASTATQKAGEASTSANNAAASASQAQTYASNAEQSATSASGSASAASGSATAAAGSASAAHTSETNAAESETAAAESAAQAKEAARTLTIDPTLTQPGQAAEAKATGDAVAELKSQIDQKAPAIMQTLTDQAIASFADGADDMPLKSLVVDITPVQEGSGDPAPDNVRPITGWTGINLVKANRNLWDDRAFTDISNPLNLITDTADSFYGWYGGSIKNWADSIKTSSFCKFPAGAGRITVSLMAGNRGETVNFTFKIYFMYSDGTESDSGNKPITPLEKKIITASSVADKICTGYRISTTAGGGNELGRIQWVYVHRYNESEDYIPMETQTYPITFPTEAGTVYGGTLDVVSGVLTVEWVGVTVTQIGSDGWYLDNVGQGESGRYWARICNRSLPAGYNTTSTGISPYGIFSHGLFTRESDVGWRAYITTLSGVQKPNILVTDTSDITTAEGYNAFLQTLSSPLQICYKLYTPVTYQLTPTEVRTFLGQNNIFADTGDIASVEYPADTKMYIDGKIADLQAMVLENISNS